MLNHFAGEVSSVSRARTKELFRQNQLVLGCIYTLCRTRRGSHNPIVRQRQLPSP